MNLFLLSWKRFGVVIAGEAASIVLHNAVSAMLGMEEAPFFIIAVFMLPLYAVIAVPYSLFHKISPKEGAKGGGTG